jgi:hypothetical protein
LLAESLTEAAAGYEIRDAGYEIRDARYEMRES